MLYASRANLPNMRVTIPALFLVALVVRAEVVKPDPVAELQIRNNLSLYALALDTKNYGLLAKVFADNMTAYYPFLPPNNIVRGLGTFQKLLQAAIGDIVTQHTLSTTVIDFSSPSLANSTVYLVSNYIGVGNNTGTTLQFYGKYMDHWRSDIDTWKSFNRTLVFLVCVMRAGTQHTACLVAYMLPIAD